MPGLMWVLYAYVYVAFMLIAYAKSHAFIEGFTLFFMLAYALHPYATNASGFAFCRVYAICLILFQHKLL